MLGISFTGFATKKVAAGDTFVWQAPAISNSTTVSAAGQTLDVGHTALNVASTTGFATAGTLLISGITGTCSDLPPVSPAPVSAHVMMTLRFTQSTAGELASSRLV